MRLAIIGNSGSGKSTLARWFSAARGAPCLDLDTIAWEQELVPRDPKLARADVAAFCDSSEHWVVEGCYAGLIEVALARRPRLVFLNLGVEQCVANCLARPWESHKYASRAEQDERLAYLLAWVREYSTRDDELSMRAHRKLFDEYEGAKLEILEPPALGAAWMEQVVESD